MKIAYTEKINCGWSIENGTKGINRMTTNERGRQKKLAITRKSAVCAPQGNPPRELCISSSSSLFVQIKIHDANKEHMIKPEQDSKVEKTTLTAALE